MPAYDLPVDELRRYTSAVQEPVDFDDFWAATIGRARQLAFTPTVEAVDAGIPAVETFDVTFSGFDGEPIRAWLHRPADRHGDLPAVVRFVGYNCGRGLPHVVHPLVLAGYAVLTMDNRGQGAVAGYTSDTSDTGGLRRVLGGHATRGIESKETYYYRRLYTDAVLAVDAARALPGIDAEQIAVAGVSQGGGIALAVAGLTGGLAGALIDVPFLSDVPRAVNLVSTVPYAEMTTVLATYPDSTADSLRVLSYFDGVHFAKRATAPAVFSVGLMDDVCPPSTVFAARNAYAGPNRMYEYPYGGHEGGGFAHEAVQLAWLPTVMPPALMDRATGKREVAGVEL
jgi:cephalosporin-C deacetylase